jgi:hypothetical protein
MARGTSLGEMVAQLRSVTGRNISAATGAAERGSLQIQLRRAQEQLNDEWDWPFMRARRDITTAAGQRYYDFPTDLAPERVRQVKHLYGGIWTDLTYGVDMGEYSAYDSDADTRADPALKYDIIDIGQGEQMEIWPIPQTASTVRLTGFRALKALLDDDDVADLDDLLIVLRAGINLSSGRDNARAESLAQEFQARLASLQGNLVPPSQEPIVPGGSSTDRRRGTGDLRVVRVDT